MRRGETKTVVFIGFSSRVQVGKEAKLGERTKPSYYFFLLQDKQTNTSKPSKKQNTTNKRRDKTR
jgi:hypothetical protein